MTMLLQNNPNTFAMRYILSEDVQNGEMRAELLQSPYRAEEAETAPAHISRRERLAREAWDRLVARRAAERAARLTA